MSEVANALSPVPGSLAADAAAPDWGAVRVRVFAVAYAMTNSRDWAEELANMTLADCIDPAAKPWVPDQQPDLLAHAFRVLKDRMSIERKRRLVRTDPRTLVAVSELHACVPTPHERLELAQVQARATRVLDAARARLSDALDFAVLDLLLCGVDRPADQAKELRRSILEIYRTRERIRVALRFATDQDEAPR